jgi:hypothetical protein
MALAAACYRAFAGLWNKNKERLNAFPEQTTKTGRAIPLNLRDHAVKRHVSFC